MIRRKLTWLLVILILLISATASGWMWIAHTESGARWAFDRAVTILPGSVTAASVSGDLYSGMHLERLHFSDETIKFEVEKLAVAVDIDLFPIVVRIKTLHGETVRISTLREPPATASGASSLPIPGLPIRLVFEDIRLTAVRTLDSSGETDMVVDSIEASGSLYKELKLERLVVALPEDKATLSGNLSLTPPHPLSLAFQSSGRIDLVGNLGGDLDAARIVLTSAGPDVRITGTISQLLQTPAWDLEITSPHLAMPLDDPDSSTRITDLQLLTSGEWPRFKIDLEADLEAGGLASSRLLISGTGSATDFESQRLSLQGPELSLDAATTISWKDGLDVDLTAALNRLEPGAWVPDWPENQPASGEFAVQWGGGDLEISRFSLAVAGTALSLGGHGVVAPDSGIVDLSLEWSEFSWPPGGLSPSVSSKAGSVKVSGRPEDWNLDGTADLQAGDFPPGRLTLSGAGNRESLAVTLHEGAVLGGTMTGRVSWNWTGDQPFSGEMRAQQIALAPLFPEYPGVLNSQLTFEGAIEPLRIGVTLLHLDGTIMQLPVSGNGGFHIANDEIIADRLQFSSGASSLKLDGNLFGTEGIDFSADVDSFARFYDEFSGSIAASGNVSLNPDSPRISAALSGRELKLGAVEIARIETRKLPDSGNGVEYDLTGLIIGERPIETLSIRLDGEQPLNRLMVSARAENTDVDLELTGAVNDWNDPLTSGWSGELSQVRLDNNMGRFLLTLDEAAAIEMTPSGFSLQPACFSGTRNARLCVASAWGKPDDLTFSADLAAIPAGLIELFYDTDLQFTQILNGKLDWKQAGATGRSGSARIEISPGEIRSLGDDGIRFKTGAGLFGFELRKGQLQSGTLDLEFPGTGDIDFDFSLPDMSQGPYSPINGTARIDLGDLSLLGPFFPLFDTLSGALDADLVLSGIVSDPAFTGSIGLTGGQLANTASGFSFSDINISGKVSDLDRAELKGAFTAGEGRGNLNATVFFEDPLSPIIELALQGDSLTVIDTPDLRVIADPDMQLEWRTQTLTIDGRLVIPEARLSPSAFPQSSIAQSADVIIVAGELPQTEQDLMEDSGFRIQGNLEVELGERAVVDFDYAKVRVSGKTLFSWRDEVIPVANGNFDLQGEIQAYGQFLRVTTGRISFPDIPADNPHLNIRAEREIYGSPQIRSAGLMVAGTVRRPLIEPYTVPMTNRDRAQTLLITGSDFNYEQGVGAVAVGTYILPRLYVSYGIGVFEDGNVFTVRYDIGRGFGVQATSGQSASGVDLNYTLDR